MINKQNLIIFDDCIKKSTQNITSVYFIPKIYQNVNIIYSFFNTINKLNINKILKYYKSNFELIDFRSHFSIPINLEKDLNYE